MILFFSPFSFIPEWALAERSVINSLPNKYNYVTVGCKTIFSSFCTSMEAGALSINSSEIDKMKVCAQCQENRKNLYNHNSQKNIYIDDFVSNIELNNIDLIISKIKFDNTDTQNIELDGINFTKIALYEIILKFKLKGPILNELQFKYLITGLRNALISYVGMKNINTVFNPGKIIIYSPQYGINNAVASFFSSLKKDVFLMEGSDNIRHRYDSLRFWKWNYYYLNNPASNYWEIYKNAVLPKNAYERVNNHILELFNANSFSVYSNAPVDSFDINQCFGIPKNRKIILLTMSSHDEAFAAFYINAFDERKAVSSVFDNQIEWVIKTVEYISSRKHLHLIIRVHPRDFTNKRESIISPQFEQLNNIFRNSLPDNISVDWPENKVSLYNLLPQIDILLTGWSVTALEASLFKKNVVIYDIGMPTYPANIFFAGNTVSEYFSNINLALDTEYSNTYYSVYQWWAINFYIGTLQNKTITTNPFYIRCRGYIFRLISPFPNITRQLSKVEYGFMQLNFKSRIKFRELIQSNNINSLFDINISVNKAFDQNVVASRKRIDSKLMKIKKYFEYHKN